MARIVVAVIVLVLVGLSPAAAGERRGTPGCESAKELVSEAKHKLRKAKRALENADSARAKREARKRVRRAKARLVDAKAAEAEACTGEARFIVTGAQGFGNQGQLDVAAAMDAKCTLSGCDYIIGLGNNIMDNGASSTADTQFDSKFETPYAGIDVPFWLGLGNHDYGGSGAGFDSPKAQNQVDYTAVSPSKKWKMPARYYRRTDGPVQFFTLDTNAQMFGVDAEQESDVSGWLSNSNADWKIALGLHTYRSNGGHGNAGTYDGLMPSLIPAGAGVRDFIEDHICGEADVYFSAYDRSLQWPQKDADDCPGTELIVSGAGASTTAVDATPDYPTHFQSTALGFAYVVIEGSQMTVDFIDKDGAVLFTRGITTSR